MGDESRSNLSLLDEYHLVGWLDHQGLEVESEKGRFLEIRDRSYN